MDSESESLQSGDELVEEQSEEDEEQELNGEPLESEDEDRPENEVAEEEDDGDSGGEEEEDDGDSPGEEEEDDGDSRGEEEEDDGDSGEEEEDGGNSGEEEEDGGNSGEEEEGISGWADSMSKILKSTKPKNKKNLILSRAKKDYEVDKAAKPKVKNEIEVIGQDASTVKAETGDESKDSDALSVKQQRKLELKQRKLEKAWENLNRITTTNPDKEFEVNLMKIATKGVVQLFNAVNQQQKTIKSKLRVSSKSEFKKDKVLSQSKEIFDKAMQKNKLVGKSGDDNPVDVKHESSSDEEQTVRQDQRKRKLIKISCDPSSSSKKPMWSALQDDFMLDAKLKDWDKESDSE